MTIAKTTIMIITDEIIFLVFLLNFILSPFRSIYATGRRKFQIYVCPQTNL